jgi:hypothetical protein
MNLTLPATHSITVTLLPESPIGPSPIPAGIAVEFTNSHPGAATAAYIEDKIVITGAAPGAAKIVATGAASATQAGFTAEFDIEVTAPAITKWGMEAAAPVLQAKYAGK